MSKLSITSRFACLALTAAPAFAALPVATTDGELLSVATADGQALGTIRLPAGEDSPAREHLALKLFVYFVGGARIHVTSRGGSLQRSDHTPRDPQIPT